MCRPNLNKNFCAQNLNFRLDFFWLDALSLQKIINLIRLENWIENSFWLNCRFLRLKFVEKFVIGSDQKNLRSNFLIAKNLFSRCLEHPAKKVPIENENFKHKKVDRKEFCSTSAENRIRRNICTKQLFTLIIFGH